MKGRSSTYSLALGAMLLATSAGAQVFDPSKYPDILGQWRRPAGVGIQWDQTKRLGRAQQAPLTPEYQAIFEASLKDQAAGGQGTDPTYKCIPAGMPRIMTVVYPMEIVITAKTTYLLFDYSMPRRIYTDGREFPNELEPNFLGYSIGKWIDEDGDGRYDALEVETRGMKGPRSYEASGIPLHENNQTVVKERIQLENGNSDVLQDEITVIDDALVRPWTVTKKYRRERNPIWFDHNCSEDNHHVVIGKENYFPERRRLSDAGQEGSGPTGFEILQAIAEVTRRRRWATFVRPTGMLGGLSCDARSAQSRSRRS
jgi:hypothetical protein